MGTPVVAGRAGGIPLQMADGAGGILVDSVEECARGIVELLLDPDRARELSARGRERVRERFLLPRLLLTELALVAELVAGRPPVAAAWEGRHDPVCGMALAEGHEAATETVSGTAFLFCSEDCRNRFVRNPAHYTPIGYDSTTAHEKGEA